MTRLAALTALSALLTAVGPSLAGAAERIAITIDDVPFVGGVGPGDSPEAATQRMLDALAAHEAQAAAFVVCDRLRPEARIARMWQAAGHVIGNHSHTHPHLDRLSHAAWVDDVSRCDAALKGAVEAPSQWFRYPYLQRGATAERRESAAGALREMGLKHAPVSVDTSEWVLVKPYVEALRRGDTKTAKAIGAAYVEHIVEASRHYRAVARADLGRALPHVLLLHANALAADYLGPLLTALAAEGFAFVPLAEALADPVYARPEQYAGPIGLSWLYRIAPEAGERWRWDSGQHAAMARRFAGAKEKPGPIDHDLRVRPVAPGTWVVTHALWSANNLLAEMPDGTLLLADTPSTPSATRRLLVWLRARFGSRPIVAIVSHHHVDALGGTGVLQAAGATVWAADHTVELLEKHRVEMEAALAGHPSGLFAGFGFTPPARTFPLAEGLRLDFGGEPVVAIHPGRNHSHDLTMVHLPQRAVLFGGCGVIGGSRPGNVAAADLEAWPGAVRALIPLAPKVVVPGHGDWLGPELLQHTADAVERFARARQGDELPGTESE